MTNSVCRIEDIVQGTPEWLAWRKTGVTATCSPILMKAKGSTKTEYELYLEYVGLINPPDLSKIKQVDAGKKLEPLARQWCEDNLGQTAAPFCVRSQQFPFMIASLDGQFEDTSILELKNLSQAKHLAILQHGQDSPEFNYYYWQVQHQLFVTGAPYAYLVFWSSVDQPKVFKVIPNKKAYESLLFVCSKFWDCVQERTAPAFDKKNDVLLISDPEILSQTKEFSIPADLSIRVGDIRRQKEHLDAVSSEFKKLQAKKDDLSTAMKEAVQGLALTMGFDINDPVRIDGFGVRFIQYDVKPSIDYKMICEKLGIDPSAHPECVKTDSRRGTLSLYEYTSTETDSVVLPAVLHATATEEDNLITLF